MAADRNSLCTVRAGYHHLLLQCLAHHGLDPARIYSPELLAELAALSPASLRPVEEWDGMVALAEQHAQEHAGGMDIVLKLAEFIKPWDTGSLGFMTMACRNLQGSTEALGQFYGLLNDVYTLHGHVDARQFLVGLKPLGAIQSARLEKLTLAVICWHARWLSRRPELVFNAVFSFAQPGPEQAQLLQRTFGGEVSYGHPESCLTGPAEYAAYAVATSPESGSVHDVLRAQLVDAMAALHESSSSFVHKLERILATRLETGQLGLDEVAAEIGVSSRTLQNRLDEVGLSYRSLLDRLRHAQAQAYMGDPDITLIQMSQLLGFATQSAFQRAFKRWTGMAPGEYRRQKLRPEPH